MHVQDPPYRFKCGRALPANPKLLEDELEARVSQNRPRIYRDLKSLIVRVPDLQSSKLADALQAADQYPFRITSFYLDRVLNGRADDPLLDVVLPTSQEGLVQPETWDANQLADGRALDSPLWSQKYPQQGLIRLTTECSAHCRYCYLRERTAQRRPASKEEIAGIFRGLAHDRARDIREVILSGGDPLMVTPAVLQYLGGCFRLCNEERASRGAQEIRLNVHTREPVWRPDYYLSEWSRYMPAFSALGAYAYVLQVIHPRELTPEFEELLRRISDCGEQRPLLLNQHPLLKGVNADADVLAELYARLTDCNPRIKPYYAVHPFDSGTLPKHRLSLPESQTLMQELTHKLPGTMLPTLVVPTPLGKAYVLPYQRLVPGSAPGRWHLLTKTGVEVDYLDPGLTGCT
jgi:L-lysine 2,3-aminomutase